MKARSGEKIKLTSIDELLGVSNSVTAEEIDIARIHPFKDHPFKVLDDEKMQELVESIEENGILTPVIVRADPAGGYEMISGHRRMHAATLLGMTAIPAVVKNLDDDDATIVMIDANIQREELLPSEKAFAYKMRYEAMKRKAGRPGKNGKQLTARNLPVAIKNSSQFERNLETAEIIGQQVGESRAQVHRFMRLTELIPELLQMVDDKRIAVMSAVEISYIPELVQKYLYEYIRENGTVKSYQVAALRKEVTDQGYINQQNMIRLLNDMLPGQSPATPRKITFSEKKLRKYFSSNYTMQDMEKIMVGLLEQWKKAQEDE